MSALPSKASNNLTYVFILPFWHPLWVVTMPLGGAFLLLFVWWGYSGSIALLLSVPATAFLTEGITMIRCRQTNAEAGMIMGLYMTFGIIYSMLTLICGAIWLYQRLAAA